MSRHRRGFTLLEVTVVSGLTAFLAVLLSSAWAGITKSTVDLVGRGRLIQEMDMAVASLSRDLGGCLAVPSSSGNLGGEDQGVWIGYWAPSSVPTVDKLRLCFDGGNNPNGKADWDPLTGNPDAGSTDKIIEYRLEPYDDSHGVASNVLVRQKVYPEPSDEKFVVAKNVDGMIVDVSDPAFIKIELTFKYHSFNGEYMRKCTLIARTPQ